MMSRDDHLLQILHQDSGYDNADLLAHSDEWHVIPSNDMASNEFSGLAVYDDDTQMWTVTDHADVRNSFVIDATSETCPCKFVRPV